MLTLTLILFLSHQFTGDSRFPLSLKTNSPRVRTLSQSSGARSTGARLFSWQEGHLYKIYPCICIYVLNTHMNSICETTLKDRRPADLGSPLAFFFLIFFLSISLLSLLHLFFTLLFLIWSLNDDPASSHTHYSFPLLANTFYPTTIYTNVLYRLAVISSECATIYTGHCKIIFYSDIDIDFFKFYFLDYYLCHFFFFFFTFLLSIQGIIKNEMKDAKKTEINLKEKYNRFFFQSRQFLYKK